MIRLTTLGSLDLRDDSDREIRAVLTQPKRFALLVYLALAGIDRFRRRDSVVALFWPELDQEHARAALRQALRHLRRWLGDRVVTARGDEEIGISSLELQCDAVAFETALQSGPQSDAIPLYKGRFCEGLFVSDAAPELDEWISAERIRLHHTAGAAAWAASDESLAAADIDAAVRWGRQAVAFAPTDERSIRRLITLLDSVGERSGAIEVYLDLERRLDTEFGATPSPETIELIRQVRSRSVVASGAGRPADAAGAAVSPVPTAPPARKAPPVLASRRFLFATGLALVVALGIYLGGSARPSDGLTRARSADSVLEDRLARGTHALSRRGKAELLAAVSYFGEALDDNPSSAQAYAGLADAYIQLGYGSLLAPGDAFPKARKAALRAIELDSTLASPHAALGYERMYFAWDWQGAEREFQLGIRMDPRHPTTHEWYGLFLAAMGRYVEAQAAVRRAQQLDPLSTGIAGTAGWVLHYSGRDRDAESVLRSALRMDSTYELGRLYLGRVLQAEGMLDSALRYYRSLKRLEGWVPTVAGVGVVHAAAGRRAEARQMLARMDSLSRTGYVTPYARALIHAALGDQDSTFFWLERALVERSHWLVWLNRDRRWDAVRSDPRFAQLTERIGLPP